MGEVASYPVGTFSWVDLGTTDLAAATAFYARLFGWGAQDIPGAFSRTSFSTVPRRRLALHVSLPVLARVRLPRG